jgi:ABC-type multidrug transport system permease subunit
MWAFIIFNAAMAVVLYWLVRVPKKESKRAKKAKKEQ